MRTDGSFPEHPQMTPPDPTDECSKCRGWGVVLGTDTLDSWGEPCDCGRDFKVPMRLNDIHDIHAAHCQARLESVGVHSCGDGAESVMSEISMMEGLDRDEIERRRAS